MDIVGGCNLHIAYTSLQTNTVTSLHASMCCALHLKMLQGQTAITFF